MNGLEAQTCTVQVCKCDPSNRRAVYSGDRNLHRASPRTPIGDRQAIKPRPRLGHDALPQYE